MTCYTSDEKEVIELRIRPGGHDSTRSIAAAQHKSGTASLAWTIAPVSWKPCK